MTREIKFRAWDNNFKKMVSVSDAKFVDGRMIGAKGVNWDSEVIVMQFTGLLDKQGKEIWEGDIVNYGNYTDNDKPCNEEIIFENCSFVGREIRKFGDKNAVSMIGKDCEVIGNIYENPDLLT